MTISSIHTVERNAKGGFERVHTTTVDGVLGVLTRTPVAAIVSRRTILCRLTAAATKIWRSEMAAVLFFRSRRREPADNSAALRQQLRRYILFINSRPFASIGGFQFSFLTANYANKRQLSYYDLCRLTAAATQIPVHPKAQRHKEVKIG